MSNLVECDMCHRMVQVSESNLMKDKYVIHTCNCGNFARYMDKFEYLVRTTIKGKKDGIVE